MFSFGWSELALTALIIIIVVGPKEIPNLLKQMGTFTKSIKKISREFKSSLNEIANDSEIKDVKESLTNIKEIKAELDPTTQVKDQIDSIKKTANVFKNEINDLHSLDNKQKK